MTLFSLKLNKVIFVYEFPVKVKPGAQEKHIPNTPVIKQEIANGKWG